MVRDGHVGLIVATDINANGKGKHSRSERDDSNHDAGHADLLLALFFPLVLGSVKLVYLSAVMSQTLQGGWLPLT
ncbi:hypothetical protein SAY87_013359 [Trapa incisa]|uniref:Uncharacterized protein n=1 Tax=Trapa incisa TaxID=236973 RepID=A0AAN7QCV0_9MYRT|nr:hypothetical protein SAY87_013359 [Trapa incisa]